MHAHKLNTSVLLLDHMMASHMPQPYLLRDMHNSRLLGNVPVYYCCWTTTGQISPNHGCSLGSADYLGGYSQLQVPAHQHM